MHGEQYNCKPIIVFVFMFSAGMIARQMGLPIHMVTAVNTNDIVARTVAQGDFSQTADVKPTLASAMDIQVKEVDFMPRRITLRITLP